MTIVELINQIDKAFDGAEHSETSLRQFVLTNKFGLSRDITDSEWSEAGKNRVDTKWQEIPDSEIQECDSMLAHMDSVEFRYFLPAYMTYALKNYQESTWGNDILTSIIFSLYPSSKESDLYTYGVRQLSLLDNSQQLAIVVFLRFVASSVDYSNSDANIALERYWNKVIRNI